MAERAERATSTRWLGHARSRSRLAAHRLVRASLKPGDVVLTGRSTGLSLGIRLLTNSPASHALLAVSNRHLLEANDHRWNMSERGGGVYLETIWHGCLHRDIDRVIVRRPPRIDTEILHNWALWKLRGTDVFASAGLVLKGMRHLGGELRRALRRSDLARPGISDFIEAIADGPGRLTCAEFVYRGVLAAGHEIAITNPYFDEEFRMLPAAAPERPPSVPRTRGTLADELRFALESTTRPRRPAGSGQVSGGPLEAAAWGGVSLRDFVRQYRSRKAEAPNGDRADFLTPRDLLASPSLTTVLHLERDFRGRWRVYRAPHLQIASQS